MKYNMKKLLSLLLALLMLIPGAMAEADYADILNAAISAPSAEMDISAITSDQLVVENAVTADELSDSTVDYIFSQLHKMHVVYSDDTSSYAFAAPVMELDGVALYFTYGPYMDFLVEDKDYKGWVVSDFAVDNCEVAQVEFDSAKSGVRIYSSKMMPATSVRKYVTDTGSLTGYGFNIQEEDGQTKLVLRSITLSYKDGNYTIPDKDAFMVGSPVYDENGNLVGMSDGDVNVYSASLFMQEFIRFIKGEEEPAAEPADEPEEEPVAAPAEEPAEEPADEPVDEPEEKPTAKPTQKPAEPEEDEDDEPAPASKGNDKGIDKNVIIGIVAVVVVAGAYFLNKKKKAEAAKKDAQQKAPERPVYNQKPSTPKAPAQEAAVTQPAGKTMLVTEVPKAPEKPQKRTVVGIRCISGSQAGANFRIEREVRIGRDPQRCSIIMPKDTRGISGLHCSVEPTSDGAIKLIDLGSTYGTFVNGQKMNANTPRILRSGERFELADGGNRFEVYTEEI